MLVFAFALIAIGALAGSGLSSSYWLGAAGLIVAAVSIRGYLLNRSWLPQTPQVNKADVHGGISWQLVLAVGFAVAVCVLILVAVLAAPNRAGDSGAVSVAFYCGFGLVYSADAFRVKRWERRHNCRIYWTAWGRPNTGVCVINRHP